MTQMRRQEIVQEMRMKVGYQVAVQRTLLILKSMLMSNLKIPLEGQKNVTNFNDSILFYPYHSILLYQWIEFIACKDFRVHTVSFYRKSSKGIGQRAKVEKCSICRQHLKSTDLKMYEGHPPDAQEETVALIDNRLALFTGKETEINEGDHIPLNKLTYFRLYHRHHMLVLMKLE